jgi:hypothetical protein
MGLGGTATSKPLAWVIGLALCASVLALATAVPAAAAACPNEGLREAQGVTSLPGCRALEVVTPPRKFAQPALLPSFSRDGERVLTLVRSALAETPSYQFYEGDFYVGIRGAGGWGLAPTSPLDPLITAGARRWGGAMLFTPELDRWAMAGSTQAQYTVGVTRMFTGGLDGTFEPLSPLLVPIDDSGTDEATVMVQNMLLPGASADMTAAIVRVTFASTGYLPDDPRGASSQPGGDRNSYVAFLDEAGEPALQLLARDAGEEVWGGHCGAHIGGPGGSFDSGRIESDFTQGAISPDGSRIYFSTRPNQPWDEEDLEGPPCNTANGLRVLKRVTIADEPTITEIAPGAGPAEPGDDFFQAASADGTRVYFLSPRKLAGEDDDTNTGPCSGTIGASKGCDLYLYDESRLPGNPLVLVSDGPGEASVLASATAVSGDGSRAYFVAQGVLTADPNPEGDPAIASQPNLYAYDAGADALSFIATLSSNDATGMWDVKESGFGEAMAVPEHGVGPEDGGDGHILAFASKASIDDDDADGGFRDIFRYDAGTDTLQRISKAASGSEEPAGDASANPAWYEERGFNFNEATRWISEDGQLIGFATKEPLIPGDTDEAINPYFWEAGTLGAAFAPLFDENGETRPPAVAPEGGQVAFSTSAPLLGFDTDTVEDIYVGRPNGGFSEAVPPVPCQPLQEGSCQGPPGPTPTAAPPPATGPSGNVNPPPKKCKKGQARRKGKCVKKKQGKGKSGKRANRSRGGRA